MEAACCQENAGFDTGPGRVRPRSLLHRYARRAAEDVIAILNRTGKREQVQEMRVKYATALGRPAPRGASSST